MVSGIFTLSPKKKCLKYICIAIDLCLHIPYKGEKRDRQEKFSWFC